MLSQFSLASEQLKQDADYQELLQDCEQELTKQFMQYQHNIMPSIQENYIRRNQILSQCFNQLEVYRARLHEAQQHITTAGEDFTQRACQKAVEIGQRYEQAFIELRNARQSKLDTVKQHIQRIADAVHESRAFVEENKSFLEANDVEKIRYERGMDFYERTKQLNDAMQAINTDEMKVLFEKYRAEHEEIERKIRTVQLSKQQQMQDVDLELSQDI